MLKEFSKNKIATAIAILFHIVGFVGIIIFKSNYIIGLTPINILLMFALLIWTQTNKNISFWLFITFSIITGIVVEMIGVNTKYLFGNYSYGNVLGFKINNVPFIIGINWFIIVYCCGIMLNTFLLKTIDKIAGETAKHPVKLKAISVIVDGATVAVFFDWLMEPAAVKLGYWKWENKIPLYNYLCWFIIAMLLLFVFQQLKFNKQNKFAIHLLMIQIMFFLLLRIFLINS